jgi:co-chaperonin GroES (HSP10)
MTKLAFEAHRFTRGQLKPLNDVVIVGEMIFAERFTNTGIVLLSDNGKTAGIRPRWGQVYAVGPEQKDVRVGEWVCVAHGRWTRGIDVEDETGKHTLRRVDPKDILLSADEMPDDLTFSDAVQAEAAPTHMQHS